MSKYCIMRFQKYKVGSVANIERHQKHRDRLKHRKHPERESENITWRQSPEKTMTQVIRGVMREQEKLTGKKVRKDAVSLVEFVLTFSPEMEEGLDFNRWHEANLKWLEEQFGEGKIIRFDTNHDEATKHGHYFVLPTDERGYLNASRYFGKKKQIIALQDSYAEAMEVFGLERGRSKEETGANHQSLNEWHKQGEERLLAEIVKIEKEKVVIEQVKNRVFADDRAVPTKSRVIGDELFDILE